jgi:entericidin B
MIVKLLIAAILVFFATAVAACNTTKGVGEDLQKGGRAIERSAERHGAEP